MANKVTIDVEARFVDNVSKEAKSASKSIGEVEKKAGAAAKEVDKLGKKKAQPKVDANTTQVTQKVSKVDKLLTKLGRKKTEAKLTALDKATQTINKVTSKLKAFGGKTYSALLKLKDSNTLQTLNSMSNGLRSITGKAWSVAIRIKDTFTAPLTTLKNMLFNVRTLIAGIASAWAAIQFVKNPINVADSYSGAKISFSTLLGASQGQQMMNNLDEFAKKTPFNTSNVISNAQKMLAMGWDAENIIADMEIIGNAAAATGKLDQGLESIVRALSQIKTKGRLSTEELNQLAEAGISAKAMLAENLGYGTGDSGIAAMTKDLEDGAIASDVAIQALLAGMQKYNGMMDSMANETVEGLISQMQDAFEINVVRKWGQGLQDGARKGFGTIIELLDESEASLEEFGDMLYEIGKTASNWVAEKLQGSVDKILEITGSYEFKNASLKDKASMLWNGVIADPLKEWWEGGGRDKTAETAGKIGSWMGEMLTKGLLALFGATDILNSDNWEIDEEGNKIGMNVAQSFAEGFKQNFDGSAITDAFVDAISNVWGALPTWAKILIGGYGVGKAAGGIANFAGGVASFLGGAKNVIGGFQAHVAKVGPSLVTGNGILGAIGKAGVGLGATTTGGALLAGTGGIAGGLAGGASLIKGGMDLHKSNQARKAGDRIEEEAYAASGSAAIGGVATGAIVGATIGSIVPVIGTALGGLIGAGVGGVAGWIGGNKWANNIRAAKYESVEMQEAVKDSEMSAEEMAKHLAKAKWENATKHFGDIKLSMAEIERLANQIVWGDDIGIFETFSTSKQAAEAAVQSLKSAKEQTDRWLWKAGLGVKFNDDEKESIVQSIDEYIAAAQTAVENKHYEVSAAVSLLVDVESEEGKSIIDSGNAFYGALQEQLNDLGSKLSDAINKALEDGVISTEPVTLPDGTLQLSEAEEIASLQNQIAAITAKVAQAEQQAELALINVKFGKGNLDYESFENFMAQMQTTIDERMTANDDAFLASVSSLNLQLEEGAITQDDYDTQLQTIIDGYTGTIDNLKAEVEGVELQIIGEAYDDVLGKDAAEDLNNALQYAIKKNIDPVDIPTDVLLSKMNVTGTVSEETASNIKDMLSGTLSQLGQLETNADLVVNPEEVRVADDTAVKVENAVDTALPDLLEYGIELGITGNENILNEIDLTAGDFGIQDSYTFSPTININPSVGTSAKSFTLQWLENGAGGQGYRGGIFGGSSAMDAFARGGVTDNSGIVGGSTRFIRVNEESPEMIIPLSSQRRERALKLWSKTGDMLGVPGFARGGSTEGGQDEGIRYRGYDSDDTAGGQAVQVDIGGVKVDIHVDATGTENIAAAIRAQSGEIAETLAGIMADALGGQFENTPVRGGAA